MIFSIQKVMLTLSKIQFTGHRLHIKVHAQTSFRKLLLWTSSEDLFGRCSKDTDMTDRFVL